MDDAVSIVQSYKIVGKLSRFFLWGRRRGSSCLATLGFGPESRWDSESGTPELRAIHKARRPLSVSRCRGRVVTIWWLCIAVALTTASAADKTFLLGGNSVRLQDVSSEVEVYFQSMRFNRAAGVWNVEATLTNTGTRTLRTPLILSIETFSNTTGPLQPDGTDAGPPPKPFYDLSNQRADGMLAPGTSTRARTLTLGRGAGSPRLTTKVYSLPPTQFKAVSVARSLDATGHPLAEVDVIERGPQGERTIRTDGRLGIATLGQGNGAYTWQFSKLGYLPVWRQKILAPNEVAVLINPRLTERHTNSVPLTPLDGGQLSSANGSVQISFPTGAFQQNVTATLTPLTAQTLPALLTLGWSPMQAFWVELSAEPSRAGNAKLIPWGSISSNERAGLVRWNESGLRWEVLQLVNGNGTNALEVALPGSAAYALLIGDTGSTAPPTPQVGQPLAGSSISFTDYSALSASGKVEPPVSAASRVAALVTAQAEVTFASSAGALPSGLLLRCEISENYDLQDGSRRAPPRYENFVVGYQRPGDSSAATLHSRFPLRPLWLLGAEELAEAVIKVDVLAPSAFTGGILDGSGGQVALEGIGLLAGAGDILGTQAVQIQGLNPTNFTSLGVQPTNIAAAFELTVTGVAEDRRLIAQFATPAASSYFVLARVISDNGVYGLEPVGRFSSDPRGNATSTEPATGDRLAGIMGAGQYVLVKVGSAQSLLTGVARNAQGLPAPGVVVRVSDQPWLTVSRPDGRYRLVAPAGQVKLSSTDLATGDTGQLDLTVADPARPTTADLGTIPAGPTVISINPANGAVAISPVTPIVLTFSEPLRAATLSATAVQLVDAQNQLVVASVTLNARNTVVTVLPTNSLAASTLHTVRLSPGITDLTGLALQGPGSFSFTTATDNLNRPRGAQVISHEPQNGIARMEGTQGIADPESPVILVNDTTGQTSTTLAKVDGSFKGEIAASVDDRLRAVFVNQNGTRTEMPVGRQLFPDGSVGLYSGGGSLTNANEELQIVMEVPPGATLGRTKFKLEPLKIDELPALTSNTPPADASLLGLFRVNVEGDPLREPVKVRLEIDRSRLKLPPDATEENTAFVLAAPRTVLESSPDGPTNVVAYKFLAKAEREDGATGQGNVGLLGQGDGRGKHLLLSAFTAFVLTAAEEIVTFINTYVFLNVAIVGHTESADFKDGKALVGTEQRLGGAVVRARGSLSVQNPRLFTLQPGELFTVSDSDGDFGMIAPRPGRIAQEVGGFTLMATHPDFPRQFASSGAVENRLRFPVASAAITFDRAPRPDVTPPAVFVLHTPPLPLVGTNVEVSVVATDDSGLGALQLAVTDKDPPNAVVSLHILGALLDGRWELRSDRPSVVTLRASATDTVGNQREVPYVIRFVPRLEPPPAGPIPPNPNDTVGPFVLATRPSANAPFFLSGDPLIIRFNEPVSTDVLNQPNAYLTLFPPSGQFNVSLQENQRELTVRFPGLAPGLEYTLTVQGVRDVSGNFFDQDPSRNAFGHQPFTLRFCTPPEFVTPISTVDNGAGAILRGAYAYVLDRSSPGVIRVFDVSEPREPLPVMERDLPGPAIAMVLIPDYSFQRDFAQPSDPSPLPFRVERKDLLAVAGVLSGRQGFHYLRIYDIGDPTKPGAFVSIAPATLSLDATALITRLEWSAPYLVAVENANTPQIHVIRLQTLLLSDAVKNLTPQAIDLLPDPATAAGQAAMAGTDANGDGDYVDDGDYLPLPPKVGLDFILGEVDTFTLAPNRPGILQVSTSRYITDVVVSGRSGFVGALVQPGFDNLFATAEAGVLATNNCPPYVGTNYYCPYPATFRSYFVGERLRDTNAIFFFPWQPKRALSLEPIGLPLVLLNFLSPDTYTNYLAVLDISQPVQPILAAEIPFPRDQFGLLQGATLDDQGRIVVSTVRTNSQDFVVLDPTKFGLPVPAGGIHPAIVGRVVGAGTGVLPFTVLNSGVSAGSLRSRTVISQTAPLIRLVLADTNYFDAFRDRGLDQRLAQIRGLRDAPMLEVVKHDIGPSLIPPAPAGHYHLLVEGPGGAGRELAMLLQSVDERGQPLLRVGAPLPPANLRLLLRRLSDEGTSPGYNVYLSRPFLLMQETLLSLQHQTIEGSPRRHILFAGRSLQIGFDPQMGGFGDALGPFVSACGAAPVAAGPAAAPTAVLARPINVGPTLGAPDRIVIRTTVDSINTNTCPGSALIHFTNSVECLMTLTLDGAPARNVVDESGNQIPVFTDIPVPAGEHQAWLFSDTVGEPGQHTFELTARRLAFQDPNLTLSESGLIVHEVEIHHAFPVGHTIVQGVDLWDGHLSLSWQDVLIPGRRLPLDFSRSYSATGNSSDGPLGAGWTHSYNVRLVHNLDCGTFTVIGGEGTGNAFRNPQPNPAKVALYQQLLPAGLNPADLDFFRPQIGYHSTLVRDRTRANDLWFLTKAGVRYHFVSEGALITPNTRVFTLREIREPNGNALKLEYLDNDPDPVTLDSVTELDPVGVLKRGFRLDYTNVVDQPRIATLRGFNHQGSPDLLGLEIQYSYDEWANLTNVIRVGTTGGADTRIENYRYTSGDDPYAHNLLKHIDPNGSVTTYEYFPAGVRGYYDAGLPLQDLPSHEIVRSVTRHGEARPGFAATDNVVTGFRYDWAGFLRYVSDPRPTDSDGAPISETEYKLNLYGATVRMRAPLGQETEMRWATDHLDGSVLDETRQPAHDVLMTYKRDAEGQEHFYEYHDSRGNLTREQIGVALPTKKPVTDAAGVPKNIIETLFAYDSRFNQLTNTIDPEGNVRIQVIDPATGNLTLTRDAEGNEMEFHYEPNGDPKTRIDSRRHPTQFVQYDLYGNVRVTRDPLGNETTTEFDERSRLRDSRDSFTHHMVYDYDGLDRRVREQRLNDLSGLATGPGAVAGIGYLPGGEISVTTNALGLVTRDEFDALNRKIISVRHDILQADGSTRIYTNAMTYDRASNVREEVDTRGVKRTHFYDALSRRVRTELSGPFGPNLVLSRASYDRVNNLLFDINLSGFTNRFEHDGLYRVVEHHLPVANAVIRTRYDRMGNKVLSTDAINNPTSFTYDRSYRLIRVADALGNVTTNSYDRAGNMLVSHHRSSGLTITSGFDALNRTTNVVVTGPGLPATGYTTITTYNDPAYEMTVTNPRGFATRTRKDGLDRTAFTTVDDGGLTLTTTFTHDAGGNVLTVADAQNGDTDLRYEYDQLNRRLRTHFVLTPDDHNVPVFEEFTYNANGNLVHARDRREIETRASFDNLNRPLLRELKETISNPVAWLVATETQYDDLANSTTRFDANRNRSVVENDGLGRPERMTDALGQFSTFTYDGVNKLSQTDKKRQVQTFSYDALNRLKATVEFDSTGVARTTNSIAYFDLNNRQEATDRRGLKTIIQFDALGRVIETSRRGGDLSARYQADPLTLEAREYDGNNNLVRITDANRNAVTHQYDGADRRTRTTKGFGSAVAATTTVKFDNVGNVLEIKDDRTHTATFDVRHTYDFRYRRISTENAKGETTKFEYDPASNLVQIEEPLGYVTRYEHDELNQLLAVDETPRIAAKTAAGITRFRYDANRNKIAQQDASTNLVTYAYDRLNRLTNILQHTVPGALGANLSRPAAPGGNPATAISWRFGYDANNNQSLIVDARGQEVALQYDWLNRLILRAYTNHVEQSVMGDPLSFQPLAIAYEYDGNGNPTNIVETKQLGSSPVTERMAYGYDALDRLASCTRFDHDDLVGRELKFEYDRAGNRTTNLVQNFTAPAGVLTAYAYDERNRLRTVTFDPAGSALTSTNTWEPDNLLARIDFPGGSFSTRTYDAADRLLTINNASTNGTVFSSFSYTYDLNGNRTQQVQLQPAISASSETIAYAYDQLNRFIEVRYGAGGALTNTYAPNGNRVNEVGFDPVSGAFVDRVYYYTQQATRPTTTFSGVNTLTRIEDKTAAAADIDYDYDRNLNQIARIQGATRRDFRYDIRDQIIQTTNGASFVEFDYNHARMRVKKLSTSQETRYLYDQDSVLLEYGPGPSFATQRQYEYGYELLAIAPSSGPARTRDFVQTDALRSTANLVSETGGLTHSYRYDAWGRIRAQAGISDNPRQYTGHYRDQETGLHYFGARYYDEEQGRFLSQDPYLGEAMNPPSLHRYLYANANPMTYVDEDGESATAAGAAAGFFWGAIQMGGAMASDLYHTRYRSSGDYLSIWAQNIIGGAEFGMGMDITAASGGFFATTAGFGLMGAGAEALTFMGRAESWSGFLEQQGEGLKMGAAFGAGAWGLGRLGMGVSLEMAGVKVTAQLPIGTKIAGFLGYEAAAGRATIAEGLASTLARPNRLARPTINPTAEENRIASKFMAQLERQNTLAEQAVVRTRAATALEERAASANVRRGLESPAGLSTEGAGTGAVRRAPARGEPGTEIIPAGRSVTRREAVDVEPKTDKVHTDFLAISRNARRDIALLEEAWLSGRVRPVRAHSDFLSPTEMGLFRSRTPDVVYLRNSLRGAERYQTFFHEMTHAYSYASSQFRGHSAVDLMVQEFYAEIRGVQGELVYEMGAGYGRSATRLLLETKGLPGLMENIYQRYVGTAHRRAVERGEAIPFIEDLEAALKLRRILK